MNSRIGVLACFLSLRFAVFAFALSLAACASVKKPPSGGVWNNTPSAPAATTSNTPAAPNAPVASAPAKFKLTRASVSWLDNPGLPVLTSTGAKSTIVAGDTATALASLRTAAPRELAAALKARQVSEGGNESITLMPVGSLLDASGATTAVIVRAIVTQRSTGSQWRVDLELGNRASAIVAKQTAAHVSEQASIYANSLVAAMQKAGML